MKRGGLVVLMMVLATGVFRLVAPSTPSVAPVRSAEAAKPSAKGTPFQIPKFAADLVDAIGQFYGAKATAGTTFVNPQEAADSKELEEHLWVPKAERPTLRFVVAFVPDPVHTFLGLQFDRGIDAIQQAAQTEGCSFDRGVVPWDAQPPPEPSDPATLDKLKDEIKEREKWPGLLIFRRHTKTQGGKETTNCDAANLFVFLVGETPTGGIRKEQFRRALAIMRQIRGTNHVPIRGIGADAPANEPLYLLGPTFSGSLYSLNSALAESGAMFGQGPVTVYSGTITSLHAQKWFEEQNKELEFAAFQENDKYLINSFAQLACDMGYDKGEIAVISEDETEFGDSVPDKGACANSDKDKTQHYIANIHFPREISQLRGAYQAASASNDSSQNTRALLPLDMQLSGNDDDNVPDFAKAQTPMSQEAVLLAIANDLHKHHTKLILLLATDPMDQLFLAQFLRRAYPSARVGVTAPDLLLTREGSTLLHGTFGLSAYALVPGVEGNFYGPKEFANQAPDEEFPSTLSQGLYNATIGMLTRIATGKRPAVGKVPCGLYAAYGRPPITHSEAQGPALAPAIQLSMLGGDGYWLVRPLEPLRPNGEQSNNTGRAGGQSSDGPTAEVSNGQPTNAAKVDLCESAAAGTLPANAPVPLCSSLKPQDGAAVPDTETPQHQPPSLNFALLLVMLLGALHAWLSCKGSILGTWEAAAQFDPIRRSSRRCESSVRDWLVTIGAMVLAKAYVMLAAARMAASSGPIWSWSTGISAASVVLLVVYAVVMERDLRKHRGNLLAARCFGGGIFFLCAAAGWVLWARPGAMEWLWSSRAMHLTSGCSVTLALLLMVGGWYWWMWYSLRGMVFTDDLRPRLPLRKCLPFSFIRLGDEDTDELRAFANPLRISLKEGVLMCAPLLLLVMPDRWHLLQTLEGVYFDRAFFFALLVLTSLLIWTLAKIILVWGRCRPMLMAIDRLPLREVFKALDEFSWSSLWSPGGSTLRESYRYVSRQLDSLINLLHGRNARRAGDALKNVREPKVFLLMEQNLLNNDKLQRQLRADAKHGKLKQRSFDGYVELLGKGAEIAGELATLVLAPDWKNDGAGAPEEAAREPKELQESEDKKWFHEDPTLVALATEYVALSYVSFLATVMVRLRSLVVAAAGIYVFLLLSISVYPFEPNVALFSMAVVLFLVSGVTIGYVYAEMHKDPTLSRLTSTTEGELGMQFWLQIAGAGAIPLLTLLAGQVPAINQVLVNFLQPALQAVK